MEQKEFIEEHKGFNLRAKLEKLQLTGFRGFKGEIDLVFDPQLTVLIGDNGAGKTSILDAIAELLVRIPNEVMGKETLPSFHKDDVNYELDIKIASMELQLRLDFPWVKEEVEEVDGEQVIKEDWEEARDYRFAHKYEVKATLDKSLDINSYIDEDYIDGQLDLVDAFSDSFTRWMRKGLPMSVPVMTYYTISRVGFSSQEDEQKMDVDIFASYRKNELSNDSFSFKALERWMALQYIMKLQKKERPSRVYDDIEKGVLQAMSNEEGEYSKIEIEWDEDRPKGEMIFVKGEARLKYSQMSSGEKVFIALVADISRQMAMAHPYSIDPLKEGSGIVLIDEVGLHLHPKWQRKIITKLIEVFPKIQFVVTTHSPLILHSVSKESIRVIRYGNIKKLDFYLKGFNSYGADFLRILNLVMNMDEIYPTEVQEKLDEYFDLIETDIQKAKENRKELEVLIDTEHPELLKGDSLIELKELFQ
jgi:predicted ATP-binding protein involved in virulence